MTSDSERPPTVCTQLDIFFFKGEQVTDGSLASIGDSGRQTGSNWTSEETLLEIDRHTHAAHTHTHMAV